MRHDELAGLIHFTHPEMNLLSEERSPVDERAIKFILRKAQQLADGISDELTAEYTNAPSVVGRNTQYIDGLRAEAEIVETLVRELTEVDISVDLKFQDLIL